MRCNIAFGIGVCLFNMGGCERQSSPANAPVTSQPRSAEVQHAIDSFKAESDAIRVLQPGDVFQHPDGLRSILSNDGLYRVAYYCTISPDEKSEPSIPPVNEPFHVKAMVFSPDVMQDLGGLTMQVDAGMPEHGHGMNVEPTVTKSESRKFLVDNMLFHMSGRWEIYFDITRDGITSRAQDEITLE